MRVLAKFLTSVSDAKFFPPPRLPEIAFLGRSNVGKSSVINSLLGSKLAKTSSTPGRTRSINFFEVRWPGRPNPELLFADLPGYGYTKISREVAASWADFVDPYLEERHNLSLCLALVDANVPAQESDQQLLEFLRTHQRPYVVVGTKCDRVGNNHLRNTLQKLAGDLGESRVLPFSARTGTGREDLWKEIREASQGAVAGN
jgi:GTP-binding protein